MLSLSDARVHAVLRRAMIVHVATRSPKGRPFMTPLWFVADGGVLYITTGPETWVAKNVTQHPEVVLLLRDEQTGRPEQVLRLHGTATRHRGLPRWRVLARVAAKYYVSPRALRTELSHARKWRLRTRYYAQAPGGFGYVRIVPTAGEFLSWP